MTVFVSAFNLGSGSVRPRSTSSVVPTPTITNPARAFSLGSGSVNPLATGLKIPIPTIRNFKAAPATSDLILPRKTVGSPG